jgi:hypothetical protein
MRMARPQFTVRRSMVAVAIAGVVMGWTVHARIVLHEEEDFGLGILFVECIGMLLLSVMLLPVVYVIYLVRKGDAYAARLRRNDVPVAFRLVSDDDASPQPESS